MKKKIYSPIHPIHEEEKEIEGRNDMEGVEK